jgi:mannose-1-phosphate guanylyltransferase
MKKVVPVILAGGIGERFWPMSRSTMPKQLLKIISEKTMTEETIDRIRSICSDGVKPLIVTGRAIADSMKAVLPGSLQYDLIVEPVGKNTAPAVALAAKWIESKYGDSTMLVLSADHDIRPVDRFIDAVKAAVDLADSDKCLAVSASNHHDQRQGTGILSLKNSSQKKEQRDVILSSNLLRSRIHRPPENFLTQVITCGTAACLSGTPQLFLMNLHRTCRSCFSRLMMLPLPFYR